MFIRIFLNTIFNAMTTNFFKANVTVSFTKALELESSTRSQGTADEIAANLWMAERRNRVTASSCGQIAKQCTATKVANLVKNLLHTSFHGNTAMQ